MIRRLKPVRNPNFGWDTLIVYSNCILNWIPGFELIVHSPFCLQTLLIFDMDHRNRLIDSLNGVMGNIRVAVPIGTRPIVDGVPSNELVERTSFTH